MPTDLNSDTATCVGTTEPLALRPREAAKAIGISERKLSELIADKTSGLPIVRLGRCVVFPLDRLREWLSQRVERTEPRCQE